MRAFREYNRQSIGGSFPYIVVNQNINITQVNSATYSVNQPGFRNGVDYHPVRHHHRRHAPKIRQTPQARPPKLFRYCASCGVLDGDLAHGMNPGALCDESVKVVKYASRQLGACAGRAAAYTLNAAEHTCDAARSACGAVGGLAQATVGLFRLAKAIFE